jgi:4-hydroxy-3-polyprenylbenzoate decarboxylase
MAKKVYENDDEFAGPASGSYPVDAMIIVPCSMKTLSAVSNGYCNTLISRAASCMLKENKLLILTPRETPVDLPFLKNMMIAKQAGAVVLPAMPGFYHKPKSVEEMVDFIVGKILDQLHIAHSLYLKWG